MSSSCDSCLCLYARCKTLLSRRKTNTQQNKHGAWATGVIDTRLMPPPPAACNLLTEAARRLLQATSVRGHAIKPKALLSSQPCPPAHDLYYHGNRWPGHAASQFARWTLLTDLLLQVFYRFWSQIKYFLIKWDNLCWWIKTVEEKHTDFTHESLFTALGSCIKASEGATYALPASFIL